jgi:indolepyruvate ferredoxin oxidoreductase
MTARADLDLASKYVQEDGTVFLTGVQAIVRVALDRLREDRRAGLHTAVFASGYPGSPLGGLDRELEVQRRLAPDGDLVHIPGHNEDLAATAITGTQLVPTFAGRKVDGVVGLWYGKGPGVDRSGDAIRHAQFVGTSRTGGVVAFVGDDPACKSSSIPHDSELALRDLDLPTLYPGNLQEILDLGRHAVAVSRFSGLWSAMRIVSNVADGAGTADVRRHDPPTVVPDFEWNGRPFVPTLTPRPLPPWTTAVEGELLEARIAAARAYEVANGINRIVVDADRAWLGIVAPGRVYYDVVDALDRLGLGLDDLAALGVRLAHVRMVHPLDAGLFRGFARGLAEILVVEEKRPLLEASIKELLYGTPDQPLIVGKRDEAGATLVPIAGALDVDALIRPLLARLRQRIPHDRLRVPGPPRTSLSVTGAGTRLPYFCSGCPHNTGAKAPKGVTLGGGIGCHSIAVIGDPELFGDYVTSTHMGAEGAPWIGIERFVDAPHFVQNMGDGTYFHSGQLAVQAAVAAGTTITFKLLYNSAVAMTGGQDTSMSNARPVPDVAETLLHQGVRQVIITTDEPHRYRRMRFSPGIDVRDRREIVAAQEELAKVAGVTVLIHDQQCAAEKRRDRKRGRVERPALRVVINERVCEGCGDCARASGGCLSLEPVDTAFGRKTRINESSCNLDLSCLDGDCPSFVTLAPPTRLTRLLRRGAPATAAEPARPTPPTDLPAPASRVGDDVTIRMPGIGGTGVVTVSQILGSAALLAGRHVWGLDQTGLSQKAGPVVSDLRITVEPVEQSNKPAAGGVDVYLAFDLIVGLAPQHLAAASPERTVGVASTSLAPTGAMVTDPRSEYPTVRDVEAAFTAAVRPGTARFADATRLATLLVGSPVAANVLLLGVAHQAGYLPVTAEHVEEAIRLNGVAVAANTAAFRWGRLLELDPAAVQAATPAFAAPHAVDPVLAGAIDPAIAPGTPLHDLVSARAAELAAYQDTSYATRYLATVGVAGRSGGPSAFTEAVARHLYKLMAYKDEYEVARLHLDHGVAARPGEVASVHLHPPVLRSLGLDRKIRFGPATTPVLRALAKAKRLRGTRADPFGYAKVRRLERALVAEYERVVAELSATLADARLDEAATIAALPDLIRGYESVKLASVERYRTEMATRLAAWRADVAGETYLAPLSQGSLKASLPGGQRPGE